nr:acyl-CoA carboxylase subunit epsilon [Arthrobacter sp. H5]
MVDQESASERVEPPLFRVLGGNPTPEELAALAVVVLGLHAAEPEEMALPTHRTWVRRDQLRLAPAPGPGSWRRSALR